MSRDHSQNHYGPNASFDGHDSDLAAAGILIESLRQQLAAALNKLEMAEACLAGDNALMAGLKNDLAAALAACKVKDEALQQEYDYQKANDIEIAFWIEEALATLPDDSALKAWLGEPVAYADPLDIAKDGNWDTFIVKHASECNDTLRFKTPLYSPKGLK